MHNYLLRKFLRLPLYEKYNYSGIFLPGDKGVRFDCYTELTTVNFSAPQLRAFRAAAYLHGLYVKHYA